MTQVKSKKSSSVTGTPSLAERYRALSPNEQLSCMHFFNAHNIAHFLYDNLSDEAKAYVTYCIRLSQQSDKIEKENSAQDA